MTTTPRDDDHPFIRRLHEAGVYQRLQQLQQQAGEGGSGSRTNNTSSGSSSTPHTPASSRDTPYGLAALHGMCDDIRRAGQNGHRDDTYNRACLRAGELIRRGDLTRETAEHYLREAALSVTDPHDFTTYKVEEKLRRVITQGINSSYETRRQPPPAAPTLTVREYNPNPTPAPTPAANLDNPEFWEARPELAHLRVFARARMCSPWAVLGATLTRVTVTIPPYVVLPPIVGSYGSLNLYVALIGVPGSGKGAAEHAAADAITLPEPIHTASVGSGEGIAHLYAHRERNGDITRDRDAVLFTVPEVDNLVALTGRQGATLLPQLRSAWSGERLGFSYADKTKTIPLDRHTYRIALLLGVQPGRAAPLLDDSDGGTPQRFLWLPAIDPNAPDTPPACPDPITVTKPHEPRFTSSNGLHPIPVSQTVTNEIIQDRRARLRGEHTDLDGHTTLTRLKTAAALAALNGRWEVNDEDWQLAGHVTAVSDATRDAVRQHLAQTAATRNQARGAAEAHRAIQVQEAVEQAAVRRVAARIRRRLTRWPGDGWATARELRADSASRDRQYVDDALEALIASGQVTSATDDRGVTKYRAEDPE